MRLFALTLALLAAPAVASAPKAEDVAAYRTLVAQDARLATAGYRLVSANAQFCILKERKLAWVIHDVAQYQNMAAALAAFLFNEPVSVAAVVPGGPADKAGVKAGDGIAMVAGTSFDFTDEAEKMPTFKRVAEVNAVTENALEDSSTIEIGFSGPSPGRIVQIAPPVVCASDFWVDTRSKLDAGADGEKVRLTSGLMAYITDDDELAAVVAHELSHNLLGHRRKLASIKRDKIKAIRATEEEADRLTVWLMANAGYDPRAALRFWQRYGQRTGLGIFSDGTHQRWKDRVAVMQAEIDLIAKTPATDGLRDPPLLQAYRNQQ